MQSQSKVPLTRYGFLLIELSVALLLLAVFTFIIAQYQSMSITTGYEAIARWKAVNAVSSFLAKATINPTLLKQPSVQDGDYVLTWERVPQKIATLLTMKDVVTFIKITATWVGYHNKKYSYTSLAGIST